MALTAFLAISLLPIPFYFFLTFPIHVPPPEIQQDGFFGFGEVFKDDDEIRPFTISIPKDTVTLMQNSAKVASAQPGLFPEGGVAGRVAHHLATFDWSQHEHFLNTFKHFTTEVEGLTIHFLHAHFGNDNKKELRIPLLILPSALSNFWHFFKMLMMNIEVIPILSNPKRYGFDFGVKGSLIFDVVLPDYPGSLFSEQASKEGLTRVDVARMMNKLMRDRLSYSNYVIFGQGDVGTEIATLISTTYPDNVRGMIITDPWTYTDGIKRQLQIAFLRPDSDVENKIIKPRSYPTLDGNDFDITLNYLTGRWQENSPDTALDKMVTLDEIATSAALFVLTDSLPPTLELLSSTVSAEFDAATTITPTSILYSAQSHHHFPRSILGHKYLNITRYAKQGSEGCLSSLISAPALATEIFAFTEELLL